MALRKTLDDEDEEAEEDVIAAAVVDDSIIIVLVVTWSFSNLKALFDTDVLLLLLLVPYSTGTSVTVFIVLRKRSFLFSLWLVVIRVWKPRDLIDENDVRRSTTVNG